MSDECGMMNEKEGAAFHSSLIIPRSSFLLRPRRTRKGERLADVLVQTPEAGEHVRPEVDADGAPAAGRERAEVAERLRLLQGAEGVGRARYRQILRVGRGDLQEDARVRAALVELPRRVEEARPVSCGRRAARRVAQARADGLYLGLVLRRLLDVVEHGDVVAGLHTRQVSLDGVAARGGRERGDGLVVGVDGERAVRGED